MPFLAVKKNPFDALGARWNGASQRAPQVAAVAASAASEVLAQAVRERSRDYDRWDDDLVEQVGAYQDGEGHFRVGLLSADDEAQQRALEAEYGTEEYKPQPLLRTAQRQAQEEAQEVFNEVFQQGLFG